MGMSNKPHFIGAAIGAVAGLAGSKIAANASEKNASRANAFTEDQLKNRHQWEVADLRAAGLNPVLSAHNTPSIGGSAMAQTPDYAGAMTNGMNSGLAAAKNRAELDLLKSQSKQSDAAAKAYNTQSLKNVADARNMKNIGDISENFGNVASGFHDMTSSAAKQIHKNWNELKDVGKDMKSGKFWDKHPFWGKYRKKGK